MESSVNDPASSIHRWIQNFLLSYRSTPHATTSSCPDKLFLQRELCTRLSLVTPDIGFGVASQQDKMKCNHDKFAKFREIAVGDVFSHVTTYQHRSGKLVLSYSKHHLLPVKSSWMMDGIGGDMLTMYFKTPLVLLWLIPALSKLHLINLLKALLLPVSKAVHPHLKSQGQWSH